MDTRVSALPGQKDALFVDADAFGGLIAASAGVAGAATVAGFEGGEELAAGDGWRGFECGDASFKVHAGLDFGCAVCPNDRRTELLGLRPPADSDSPLPMALDIL